MEKYLAVIKVLANWDSITLKQITCKADSNLALPKEYLNFLVKLDLIMEKNHGAKKVYSITDRGQRLYKYFGLNDEDDNDPIFDGTNITRID
jgi:predicted transcriptional regulator